MLHTTKNVLIVDSNTNFAQLLATKLQAEGFSVQLASDAMSAQSIVKQSVIHAALINASLYNPQDTYDFSGIDLAANLRAYTRIIIFADKPGVEMVRYALAQRANAPAPACDFIAKAEGAAAMITSLRKVLNLPEASSTASNNGSNGAGGSGSRSSQNMHPRSSECFILDHNARIAVVNGANIHLNDREYRLLHYFMDHSETVISREEIVVRVFHEIYDAIADGNRVNNIISRLRKRIEPDIDFPQFLITRWGSGWMFFPAGDAPQLS
jgi:DNA-binding response OmpR family regulator